MKTEKLILDNKARLKCEMYQNEDATVDITYGLYSEYEKGKPHYNHKLCKKASGELFDRCAVLVNQGLMQWSNKEIKNYK